LYIFRERKAHVPEPFWKIVMKYGYEGKVAEFFWARVRLFDYYVAVVLYEMCVHEGRATVTKDRFRCCATNNMSVVRRGIYGIYVKNVKDAPDILYVELKCKCDVRTASLSIDHIDVI
jgi:hypothetical protein